MFNNTRNVLYIEFSLFVSSLTQIILFFVRRHTKKQIKRAEYRVKSTFPYKEYSKEAYIHGVNNGKGEFSSSKYKEGKNLEIIEDERIDFPVYTQFSFRVVFTVFLIRFLCCLTIVSLILFSSLTDIEYIPLSKSPIAIIYMVVIFLSLFLEMFSVWMQATDWLLRPKKKER